MTVYKIITANVVHKIKALIAEYRKLVSEATAIEKSIVTAAENEAKRIIAEAEAAKAKVLNAAKAETSKIKKELIEKLIKL